MNMPGHNPANHVTSGGIRFSENNFDLIRLIAAAEVAFRHTVVHVSPDGLPGWLETPLALVPGVPIFYFLSGFLISRAWERSPTAIDYFRNRALRLFPALWTCVALATISLFATGYLSSAAWAPWQLGAWIFGQCTVFQFWTPDFLRAYGVGAVNGSLATISIEIQFYCLTAGLYLLLRRCKPATITFAFASLAFLFAPINHFKAEIAVWLDGLGHGTVLAKLFAVSFLPWYFMFLLGALAQRLSDHLLPLLVGRIAIVVALYVGSMFVDFHLWGLPLGNEMPTYLVPVMGATVLAVAYSAPWLSSRVLKGNDLSYGLYIYHMPVVNVAVQSGTSGSPLAIAGILATSVALAFGSWKLIERPFLRRKRNALRVVASATSGRGRDG